MTTQFASVSGSPRIVRTTNLPASGRSFAMCAWVRISTYADWPDTWSLNDVPNGHYVGIEGDSGGTVYSFDGISFINLWTDARTSWNFIAQRAEAGAGTNSTIRTYTMTTAGVWTVHTTFTKTVEWAPTSMSWGDNEAFTTDGNGTFQLAGMKLWGVDKAEHLLRAEAFSLKPRDWSNLLFWNAGLDAANVQVDYSGNGGNFTKTGTPTDSTSDPGMPWQRE